MTQNKCQQEDDSKRQKFLISLRASDLKNIAGLFNGKPDPFAVVSLIGENALSTPKFLGKTEVIRNSQDPQWIKAFLIDYELGKRMYVKVEVFDEDRTAQKHKLRGSAIFEIGEMSTSKDYAKEKKMKDGSSLIARLDKAPAISSGHLAINLKGIKLKNMELLGKSDPFFELSRKDGSSGNAWRTVYRSTHIDNELNPKWQAAMIDLDLLCDGEQGRPIKISVFDFEESGKHRPMGSFETTVNDLFVAKISAKENGTIGSFALIEKEREMGRIVVADASVFRDSESTSSADTQNQDSNSKGMQTSPMTDVQDSEYLTISLQGIRLKNVEFGGKSDPFFELSRRVSSSAEDSWLPVFRSEHLENDLNAMWNDIQIDLNRLCDGDRKRPIKISVYDHETNGNHRPMGSFVTTVSGIVSSKISTAKNNIDSFALLEQGKEVGRIVVADAFFHSGGKGSTSAISSKSDVSKTNLSSANDISDEKYLRISFQGVQLKNLQFVGNSDPFFELSRKVEQKTGSVRLPVFRSERIDDDLNPKWKPANISLNRLCDGDKEKLITVSVYHYEKSGNHKEIGSFETTVIDLLLAKFGGKPNCRESSVLMRNVLMRNGECMGEIGVLDASIINGRDVWSANDSKESEMVTSELADCQTEDDFNGFASTSQSNMSEGTETDSTSSPEVSQSPNLPRHSFSDYIDGGCELKMSVAIDFGESNGCPQVPGSLHHISEDGTPNEYEKAIKAVGSLLEEYDSDHRYPVWGFGARFGGKLKHCFQVGPNAEAQGIDGILEGYREMFKSSMHMSSPSIFTGAINEAACNSMIAQDAAQSAGNQCYTVLFILTNTPVINLLDETKDAIAAASVAPLSIVIVGMGDAEFKGMQYLDNFATGQTGSLRDIIDFIKFRDHRDTKSLHRAIFAEIPNQLVEYFHSRSIIPNPVLIESESQIVPVDATDSNSDPLCDDENTPNIPRPTVDKSENFRTDNKVLSRNKTKPNLHEEVYDTLKGLILRAACLKGTR